MLLKGWFAMLSAYLPALVFILLGLALGVAFTLANRLLGPRRPGRVKREPYESGLPSSFSRAERFAVDFYLVGMMFLIFSLEVLLLYPVALLIDSNAFALWAIVVFIFFLAVAYVYEWARGTLDWAPRRPPAQEPDPNASPSREHPPITPIEGPSLGDADRAR